MRLHRIILAALCLAAISVNSLCAKRPWDHGRLSVSANSRFLCHADSTPFFWLGDTGWLLPQRLDRDEAAFYLRRAAAAGYNVVQVQVLNGIP